MASVPPNRQLKHTRAIVVQAYARDDGLWDLEAQLTDTKTRDLALASGVRPAGLPVHDMHLRVTIDRSLNVVEAHAESRSVPYPGECETIAPDYGKLVGLNLMQGFRHALRERLGGAAGCTHMSELAAVLPTAAVQAFAGEVSPWRKSESTDPSEARKKPFMIDRCHALKADGAVVLRYYPEWYHKNAESDDAQ